MADPVEIAEGLTEAQRRAVICLRTDGEFTDYKAAGIRQRSTRMKLNNSGITEWEKVGAIAFYSSIRLTPLGLAVRQHLKDQQQ